jgi:hypothetical protein
MFAPVILGSDKTTVSVATGQNDFYPLYASLGNVHNSVRRAHREAVSLIAFLSIPKSQYISYWRNLSNPFVQRPKSMPIKPTFASFAGRFSTPPSYIFSQSFTHI